MAILSVICGLLGCQKAPKPAEHELSDITAVSISCGEMDLCYGYSFWAHNEENTWLLDAECFTHNFEVETILKNRQLTDKDIETLFEILEQNNSISYVENYQNSKKFSFQTSDGSTYSFCLTFSDGNQYVTCDRQNDLEEFFYHLAEKYDEIVSK